MPTTSTSQELRFSRFSFSSGLKGWTKHKTQKRLTSTFEFVRSGPRCWEDGGSELLPEILANIRWNEAEDRQLIASHRRVKMLHLFTLETVQFYSSSSLPSAFSPADRGRHSRCSLPSPHSNRSIIIMSFLARSSSILIIYRRRQMKWMSSLIKCDVREADAGDDYGRTKWILKRVANGLINCWKSRLTEEAEDAANYPLLSLSSSIF